MSANIDARSGENLHGESKDFLSFSNIGLTHGPRKSPAATNALNSAENAIRKL
jgi:hypothetical protein